jgi:hypothetical protein
MIAIHVRGGAWSLRLPDGRTLRGQASDAPTALCRATRLAARLEPLILGNTKVNMSRACIRHPHPHTPGG